MPIAENAELLRNRRIRGSGAKKSGKSSFHRIYAQLAGNVKLVTYFSKSLFSEGPKFELEGRIITNTRIISEHSQKWQWRCADCRRTVRGRQSPTPRCRPSARQGVFFGCLPTRPANLASRFGAQGNWDPAQPAWCVERRGFSASRRACPNVRVTSAVVTARRHRNSGANTSSEPPRRPGPAASPVPQNQKQPAHAVFHGASSMPLR